MLPAWENASIWYRIMAISEAPKSEPNPYQPPAASGTSPSSEWVWPDVVEALAKTQPWVLFLAIVGYLCGATIVISKVYTGIFGILGAGARDGGRAFGALLFDVLFGALLFIPSTYLHRFANGIDYFRHSKKVGDLGLALSAQKSFWKFCGIFTIVFVAFAAISALFSAAGGK